MLYTRFFVVTAAIGFCAAARLLPHPHNMTPIAGMALFGGACFVHRTTAFAIPLAAMLLSDLGLILLRHGTLTLPALQEHFAVAPYVYGSYLAVTALGLWIGPRRPIERIATATLAASVLFFLVTNFGTWVAFPFYPHTWDGLVECYLAGIPFFRNELLGNVVTSLLLFGGFALAERYVFARPLAPTSQAA